jgi:hypothetical protein
MSLFGPLMNIAWPPESIGAAPRPAIERHLDPGERADEAAQPDSDDDTSEHEVGILQRISLRYVTLLCHNCWGSPRVTIVKPPTRVGRDGSP